MSVSFKKIKLFLFFTAMLCGAFLATLGNVALATPPRVFNYQSRLTLSDASSTPVAVSTTIRFMLYNAASGGSYTDTPSASGPLLWIETHDGVTCDKVLPDTQGYFSIGLGDCVAIPSYIDFSTPLYLGVKIDTDSEATPRVRINSFPYALYASSTDAVDNIHAATTATANKLLALSSTLGFDINTGVYSGGMFNMSTTTNTSTIAGHFSVSGNTSLATATITDLIVGNTFNIQGPISNSLGDVAVDDNFTIANNATTTGNMVIGGTLNVSGTSTFATTTISALTVTGTSTLGNVSISSLNGTSLTITNATNTNLVVIGNTTLANATATNFFASTGTFTNIVLPASGSISSTNLIAQNSTTTNLVVTNNTTLANATATNFFASTGTFANLSVSSTSTFSGAMLMPGMTAGSVLFITPGGQLSQNNSAFFWDNTNVRLGIGTSTPTYALVVAGDINATGTYRINGADYGQYFIDSAGAVGSLWKSNGSGRGSWITTSSLGIALGDITGTNVLSYLANNNTFTGQNTFSATTTMATTSISRLTLSGAFIDGNASSGTAGYILQTTGTSTLWVPTSSLGITGGSANPGGASGQIQYNNGGSFGGTNIYWDSASGRLGIGTTTPAQFVEVNGGLRLTPTTTPLAVTGTIFYSTASSTFVGYGASGWAAMALSVGTAANTAGGALAKWSDSNTLTGTGPQLVINNNLLSLTNRLDVNGIAPGDLGQPMVKISANVPSPLVNPILDFGTGLDGSSTFFMGVINETSDADKIFYLQPRNDDYAHARFTSSTAFSMASYDSGMAGHIGMGGDPQASYRLTVYGSVKITENLDVLGITSLNELNVTGFANFTGETFFIGTTTFSGTTTFTGSTTIAGDLTVNGDIHASSVFAKGFYDTDTTGASGSPTDPILPYPDLAESFPTKDQTIAAAEVVSFDTANSDNIVRSASAYDEKLAGVISTVPRIWIGRSIPNGRPVALVGRIPVKISLENGEVKIGDYLTSSNTPGKAMKATKPGRVIGVALMDYSQSDLDSGKDWTLVFANPHFWAGNGDESLQAQINILQQQVSALQNATSSQTNYLQGSFSENVNFEKNIIVKGQTEFGTDNVGQAKITAGNTRVQIIFANTYARNPIVTITPLGKITGAYWVENQAPTGFEIVFEITQATAVMFNWHAFAPSSEITIFESPYQSSNNNLPEIIVVDLPPVDTPIESTTTSSESLPAESNTQNNPTSTESLSPPENSTSTTSTETQ